MGSSSTSKQEPVGAGQSTADDPPLATLPKDKTASSSVGAAQRGRVVPPHVPTTPNSEDQPTSCESVATKKERSESALAPTAALGPAPLYSASGLCVFCVGIQCQPIGVTSHLVALLAAKS